MKGNWEVLVFGKIMRGHRRRLGLTQEELAERTGMSVRSIRNLEADRVHAPRAGTLRLLAEAFGLDGVERDRLFTVAFLNRRPTGNTGMPQAPSAGLYPDPSLPAGDGWHTARFSVLVRLDTPRVETYQDWRIVADRDGLDRVTPAVTTPLSPGVSAVSAPVLTVDVRYGAKLLLHEQPLPHRSRFTLKLPRPLRAGQSHDCGIIVRLDAGQPMRPHYVLTATRPCQRFTLRVRFHPDRQPRWVRRVSGEPVRTLDIVAPGAEPLDLDAAGEIYTEFDQPAMHLAYGAQWQPADDPAG